MRVPAALYFILISLTGFGQEQLPELSHFERELAQAKELTEEQPERAIPILLRLKATVSGQKDPLTLADINSLLGNSHYYLADDSIAIQFWKEALSLGLVADEPSFIAGVYNNLANGFSATNPDSAIAYYKKSIALYKQLGQNYENCTQYLNLFFFR